jgi:tetratricopeptide (TPR) repeat protein
MSEQLETPAVSLGRSESEGDPLADVRGRLIELANDLQAALAHHQAGRLEEAEALYLKLLEKAPNHPQALRLLGAIEIQRGRPARGAELIGKAFPALSFLPEAHLDLGYALYLSGNRERALESFRQAITLKPHHALAHARVGVVLCDLGRFEAAITHYQTALAVEPRFLPARIGLAVALKRAGRMPEAAEAWRAIIAADPTRGESYHRLGLELVGLGLLAEALSCHDRAIALEPENAIFNCARGNALILLHEGEQAAAAFRRAIACSPDSREGWEGLGWAQRMLGRFDEADACVQRLRAIDPADLRAVGHLPSTGGQPNEPAEIERLAAALERPDLSEADRIMVGFALGRLLDSAGDFDAAFPVYASANALARKTTRADAAGFNAEFFARHVDRLIETCTPDSLAVGTAYGAMSELPVFVVGMPRSGTTLVEQICASHSRVFGAGELSDIPLLAVNLARAPSDESSQAVARRRAADAHVLRLHKLDRDAVRIVDKFPDNVLSVGLIAQLFPRARIVYCSRDARDISLSCYFQLFADGAQPFSYDLADCGRRCRGVERLALHWLTLLPSHAIEVNYETLVADLEGQSRRLIEFLGLDWEPACLDFHRTERTVVTVSHWQVRQPLYKSSVGRWRHYEKHLGPLLAALDDSMEPPPAAANAETAALRT